MPCYSCNNTGVKLIGCCSGSDCGCMGMPTMFINCECGQQVQPYEKLVEEYEEKFLEFCEWRVNE